MSAIAYSPPVASRRTPIHHEGESSNAPASSGAQVAADTEGPAPMDPRVIQRGTMSSAAFSGKARSSHHAAADFRGRGISWSIICLALCTVVGLTIAYYYTENFVFALISATTLRAVGLCAVMVPALFRGKTFRLERRRTFALLCLLSLIAVIISWVLWHTRTLKWPKVLLTISDVFSVVAGVQLAISDAYAHTPMYEDEIDMNEA